MCSRGASGISLGLMFSCPKPKVDCNENSLNDSGMSGHPLNASFRVSAVLEDGSTEGSVRKI